MRRAIPIRFDYAAKFRCIGAACEDTCCGQWSIPIDREAYEKYQKIAPGSLRALLDKSVTLTDAGEVAVSDRCAPADYAKIRLDDGHQCPLLSNHRLCRIQAECGSDFLSHTCATYPRIVQQIGQAEEKALTLSCPEAARFVLLNPDLLRADNPTFGEEVDFDSTQVKTSSPTNSPCDNFRPIRASIVKLVLNRAYPLWQRLFLLGVLCRRLDSIAAGELKVSVLEFLGDFDATVASGSLRTAMETIPMDLTSQLDVVLRLAGLLLHRSHLGPRFVDTIKAFTAGIGNGPEANLVSLTAHYAVAHDRYYAPFFSRNPHMLENYLVNTIIRCRFPFGKRGLEGSPAPSIEPPSVAGEYALLTAQFALMKGLLIGVAGFYREDFAPVHVVQTVQAASRHFEHHPEFLNLARGLLAESQMDGARGLAILLRNGPVVAPQTATRSPLPASPFTGGAMEPDRPSAPSPHQPPPQN